MLRSGTKYLKKIEAKRNIGEEKRRKNISLFAANGTKNLQRNKTKTSEKISVFFSAEHAKPVQIGFCNGSLSNRSQFLLTSVFTACMTAELQMLATLA